MVGSFVIAVAITFPAAVFVALVALCLAVESGFPPHTMAWLLLQ